METSCYEEENCEEIGLNQRPVAICQSIFRTADSACEGHAFAQDFDSGSYDPDGDPLFFTAIPSGPYPLGTTMVELTITDGNGGRATCFPSILVLDETAPSITCAGALVPLDTNGEANLTPGNLGVNSSDNCSTPSVSLSQSNFTCADLGTMTIVVSATDASGNVGACNSPISVLDLNNVCPLPPVARCQDLTFNAGTDCQINVTAEDFDNGSLK